MGYDHSMNAEIEFKPNVSIDTALAALQPLSEYCGWKREDLLASELSGDDMIELTVEEGMIRHMSIYTCGEVGHSYSDLVEAFAENLSGIAEAGSIELRDHDTGDLENAISTIWYGGAEEVAEAQRRSAWQQATSLLQNVGVSDEELASMAAIGGFEEGQKSQLPSTDHADENQQARFYIGKLLERNGKHEYTHTFRFLADDPERFLDGIASRFYDDDGGDQDGDGYCFNGGALYVKPSSYHEITKDMYVQLHGIVTGM